jgi:hypothetical protein
VIPLTFNNEMTPDTEWPRKSVIPPPRERSWLEEITVSPIKTNSMPEQDPHGKDPNSPGAKLDLGKNRVWLFTAGFANALEEVARVTTKGAEKYTPNGWVEVPNGIERYMDAFGRHMMKLGKGEIIDLDTGCYHKAQMIWNLLASLELELREKK